MDEVTGIFKAAKAFEEEAHRILGIHEASPSRVVLLERTYTDLGDLSLEQDDLFRQALRCVENELFRAAHVMAWAAFMDFFENKLAEDGLQKLRSVRAKWKLESIEELREGQNEYQIIEASKDTGLCSRTEARGLLGLLNTRNQCAHPSTYFPGLNETLGFASQLLHWIKVLATRSV